MAEITPYDKTHRLHKLLLVCVVVNEGQEDAIAQLCYQNEAYACFMTRGRGTALNTWMEVTGIGELRKVIVFSIIRDDTWNLLRKSIEQRFAVSKISKGIAFCVNLTSVMSISVYKMLGNIRIFENAVEDDEKKKKKKIIGGKKK